MKKIIFTILIVIVIALSGLALYVKFGLPNVGNAPDLKVERSQEKIARGEYLANHVTVCMDCHSTRDWKKYSGPIEPGTLGKGGEYFGPEMGFPGKFYSKNITPYHLGNWTDGQIFRAITTGVNKDGDALFPVMPYSYYGRMDKEDIEAIIAYLRTLTPIESNTPQREIDFPLNFIVNTIPDKAHFTKRPPKANTVEYGAYLVNASGCRECHTPADDKGKIDLSLAFTGGRAFKMPGLMVRSANLTPDNETGLGNWTSELFVQRFKAYSTDSIPSGNTNTIMPWTMYAGMDTLDLEAIFTYLHSLKPVKNKVEHFEVVSVAKK